MLWDITGSFSSGGSCEVWLGDLAGRQAAGKAELFDLNDPQLSRLWAQARVFAGKIDYPQPAQRQLVKTWLNDWATQKATLSQPKIQWLNAAEAFIKKLMASKEDALARFARSDLGIIFAELKGP